MIDFKQAVKADSDQSFSFIDRAAPDVHIAEGRSSNLEEAEKFNQLGTADMQNEKFQDAVANFTQAISFASREAEAYINRGRAFLKLDKPDEAMADFNEAALFDPLNASLYYWRAQAWGAKNDQSNMKEDLKRSCEIGHEPACRKYRELKSDRKYPLF
jgi:tetratricopeptide (TPR) repeat protein